MAYLESFLLYVGLVFIGGIILLLFLWMFTLLLDVTRKLFLKKERMFSKTVVIKKIVIVFTSIYLIAISVFYIQRANALLFTDRPYKEAKAYSIAGEYVLLWKAALMSVVFPNNEILKPLNAIESYILTKIYSYIPKTDAEREIWNYKFNLIDYARTMYAPMIDADIKRGLSFTNPAASMKPELLTILRNIYNAMDTLSKQPMKDKEFDEIDRYLVISAMAPYYIEYLPYMADLQSNWKKNDYYLQKFNLIYNTPKFKKQFLNYLSILNKVYDAFQKDKRLAKAFEKHPRLKASYYWAATNGYSALDSMQERIDDIYPCTNSTFLKWVKNYKEFVKWAYMTPGSSFLSLSKRDKKNYAFKIENQNNAYYIAKYICKIPFEYKTKQESHIGNFHNFEDLYIDSSNIIHIRKIQKK